MEHPVKTAPCLIYFEAHGGKFDDNNKPLITEGTPILCDRAYDCGTCPYLNEAIKSFINDGWIVGWECLKCWEETKNLPIKTLRPGYYQSGRDPDKDPFDGALAQFDNTDTDNPGLTGCTRCGWQSSFLTLVLRKE